MAFLGPPGVGKTMLAVGLAIAAYQAGFSIYFTTLDDMSASWASRSHRAVRQEAAGLLEALGARPRRGRLPAAVTAGGQHVFQLVSRRYERGSVIVTSNKAFGEWGQVFGDDVLAPAILDRLLHRRGDLHQRAVLPPQEPPGAKGGGPLE